MSLLATIYAVLAVLGFTASVATAFFMARGHATEITSETIVTTTPSSGSTASSAVKNQSGHGIRRVLTSRSIRLALLSVCLLLLGGAIVLIRPTDGAGPLVTSVGTGLILAGIVVLVLQVALPKTSMGDDFESMSRSMADTLDTVRLHHAAGVASGIQLITERREKYEGYYHWAYITAPQTLWFAGRSVLHRIDVELESRGHDRVEQVLLRKLQEGCTIRILFVDPSSDIVPGLAEEEGSPPDLMMSNLAVSVGVCRRLHQLVLQAHVPSIARLDVRVYREAPYFAYHRENDLIIVGFYFRGILGGDTPAFQVMDPRTQALFERHLEWISSRARRLLVVDPPSHDPYFDYGLYDRIEAGLAKYLTREQLRERLVGRVG